MRLGRSERYGHLTCGGCSEAQRDELRCPLRFAAGKDQTGKVRDPAPRAPADVPFYRIEMGRNRRAEFTKQCPVGLALTDDVTLYLNAYALVERWGKWPPGRDDPQVLEAIMVIRREHDLIDLERLPA